MQSPSDLRHDLTDELFGIKLAIQNLALSIQKSELPESQKQNSEKLFTLVVNKIDGMQKIVDHNFGYKSKKCMS